MLDINNLGGEFKSDLYKLSDNNAVTRFVNNVLNDMDPILTSRQLTELHNVLQNTIQNYSISTDKLLYKDIDYHEVNDYLLKQFFDGKRLAGLSERTLKAYKGY